MFARKISVSCLVFFIVILFGSSAFAVPAAPVIHTLGQPDGSIFEARQWGDEWLHGWETVEGHTIMFDQNLKSWVYAVPDSEGALVSSLKVVGKTPPPEASKNIRPKGQARSTIPEKRFSKEIASGAVPEGVVPSTGTGKIPVILINFSNTTATYTAPQFNTLLFGTSTNSMKDYYQQVSYNAFSVSGGAAGVMGWYNASNTHDYYGSDSGGTGNDAWPGDLVYEAVAAADATVNFAEYDTDGDCYVDVVAIVHQGTGQEASGVSTDIWSHSWNLSSALFYGRSHHGAYTTKAVCTANPSQFVKINNYIIQPERISSSGPIETIGVFCHEYGHALGLPDLYDTDYTSEGVGNWSLMAGGAWNYSSVPGDRPAHLDAWSKYKLGWVTPTQVTTTLTNEPIQQAATAADVYKLLPGTANPPSGEYFLVENRQKTGFDIGLPGAGLLIWHIDESKTGNTQECPYGPPCTSHYKVALVQADNLWNLENNNNRGDAGDPYPGSANNTSFTACTAPNSNLYSGTASGVSITNISASASTMTATLSTSDPLTCGGGALYTMNPNATYSYIYGSNQITSWVGNADDGYYDLSLAGFDFQFYRKPVTSVRISTNGYITFGTTGTTGTEYFNVSIPNVSLPNAIIAPFWDDLDLTYAGSVRWSITGAAPNRQLIIEWYQVPSWDYEAETYSFEVILYESSDRIKFQYLDVDSGTSHDLGASATVGIENFDGTAGLQSSYNTASLSNGKAIEFIPVLSGIADFNGDGKADILWRHATSGETAMWLMNGTTISSSAYLPTVSDPNWQIVGVGDFNGDGKADILWRHATSGETAMWLMSGTTISSSAYLPTVSDPNWQIVGVGDFNGDGKADILWRHATSGETAMWLMNGTTISSSAYLPTVSDPNWQIVGVGDFNGDGKADILWRHATSGETAMWLMNGTTISSSAYLPTVSDPNWQIVGVGDFNGDGNSDILWHHATSGETATWLMNGMTISSSAYLPTLSDTNWQIVGVGDFDGDGKVDILWRHATSGLTAMWLMNGTTIPSSAYLPTVSDMNWQIMN